MQYPSTLTDSLVEDMRIIFNWLSRPYFQIYRVALLWIFCEYLKGSIQLKAWFTRHLLLDIIIFNNRPSLKLIDYFIKWVYYSYFGARGLVLIAFNSIQRHICHTGKYNSSKERKTFSQTTVHGVLMFSHDKSKYCCVCFSILT